MRKMILTGIFILLFVFLAVNCSKKAGSGEEQQSAIIASGAVPDAYRTWHDSFLEAIRNKNYPAALENIDLIKNKIWEESPLLLLNPTLVKTQDNAYGHYEAEDDDIYSDGQTIYLYLEPAGYIIKQNENGYYEFRFLADFQVADENGQILDGQERFVDLPFQSWHPNKEVAITFNYNFSGLTPGKYKIITTVYDANSDKTASTETWVTFE
ncbi:MAG: hypothetical protein ACUVRL_09510 [Candidatus Saccharicenans sp.]|uniref:hypothetical protein n=1 Tax=Candidatus Saccharicenans sp. TaxID=2819258 RepID=UPI00404A4772